VECERPAPAEPTCCHGHDHGHDHIWDHDHDGDAPAVPHHHGHHEDGCGGQACVFVVPRTDGPEVAPEGFGAPSLALPAHVSPLAVCEPAVPAEPSHPPGLSGTLRLHLVNQVLLL
jgi:hypothetical protein